MIIYGEYNRILIDIDSYLNGKSLKEVLRGEAGISSRLLKTSKKTNAILLNGIPSKINKIVYEGDVVSLMMNEKSNIEAEEMDLDIVYEDDDVLVINKDPFVLVHPTKNVKSGTLLNGLIKYSLSKGESYKPHLVNRLDRDTSGLLIVGKNAYSHYELMKEMEESKLEKKYLAICKGGFKNKSGLIDLKISDKKHEGINRILSDDGKKAETVFRVIEDSGDLALVELELITGRTHQIRLHMSEIGHPLVGDSLYGSFALDLLNRQALHAYSLKFRSPRRELVEIKTELPEDMKKVLGC